MSLPFYFVKPNSDSRFCDKYNPKTKYSVTKISRPSINKKINTESLPRTLSDAKKFDHLIADYANYQRIRSEEIEDTEDIT